MIIKDILKKTLLGCNKERTLWYFECECLMDSGENKTLYMTCHRDNETGRFIDGLLRQKRPYIVVPI